MRLPGLIAWIVIGVVAVAACCCLLTVACRAASNLLSTWTLKGRLGRLLNAFTSQKKAIEIVARLFNVKIELAMKQLQADAVVATRQMHDNIEHWRAQLTRRQGPEWSKLLDVYKALATILPAHVTRDVVRLDAEKLYGRKFTPSEKHRFLELTAHFTNVNTMPDGLQFSEEDRARMFHIRTLTNAAQVNLYVDTAKQEGRLHETNPTTVGSAGDPSAPSCSWIAATNRMRAPSQGAKASASHISTTILSSFSPGSPAT